MQTYSKKNAEAHAPMPAVASAPADLALPAEPATSLDDVALDKVAAGLQDEGLNSAQWAHNRRAADL